MVASPVLTVPHAEVSGRDRLWGQVGMGLEGGCVEQADLEKHIECLGPLAGQNLLRRGRGA